jgi:hypothetical protein
MPLRWSLECYGLISSTICRLPHSGCDIAGRIAAAWPAAKRLPSKCMYREVTDNQVPLSETRFSTHAKAQATFMLSFVE